MMMKLGVHMGSSYQFRVETISQTEPIGFLISQSKPPMCLSQTTHVLPHHPSQAPKYVIYTSYAAKVVWRIGFTRVKKEVVQSATSELI